jgi:hypothetical protein
MADANSDTDVRQFDPVEVHVSVVQDIDKYDLLDTDYEVLIQMGIEVSETKIYTQWILGKLGDAVSKKYGDLKDYASKIRQNHKTLEAYVYIYRKFINEDPEFTPEKYIGSIPWGVMHLAASKSDKPQELLATLSDKGMDGSIEASVRGIEEINNPGQVVPPKPKIGLKWSSDAEKYQIKLNPDDLVLIDWSNIKEQLLEYLNTLT